MEDWKFQILIQFLIIAGSFHIVVIMLIFYTSHNSFHLTIVIRSVLANPLSFMYLLKNSCTHNCLGLGSSLLANPWNSFVESFLHEPLL